MQYFKSAKDISSLKTEYRDLIKRYHPDLGPAAEFDSRNRAMADINQEYERLFQVLKDRPGASYQDKGANVYDGYREQVEKVIHYPGLIVEICGAWIWVTGNTRAVKDQLHAAGYIWAPKKKAWFWRPEQCKNVFRHKGWEMDRIRDQYGSTRIETEERENIA